MFVVEALGVAAPRDTAPSALLIRRWSVRPSFRPTPSSQAGIASRTDLLALIAPPFPGFGAPGNPERFNSTIFAMEVKSRSMASRMCKVPAERNCGDKCDGSGAELDALGGASVENRTRSQWVDNVIQTWAKGIRSTLKQLDVKPLGVLIGTPIAANNPGTCLSAHLSHIQVCATPTSEAYSIGRDKDDAAAVVASHALVVNLSSLFCGARCPDVIGDQLVFADNWHLHGSYALQLSTAFGSLIACIGAEVPADQNPPGGVLQSLLEGMMESSIAPACKAVNSPPYDL
jgi:hypothetical protein